MFILSLFLFFSKILLICNVCDEVLFLCLNDVILYFVEELVIKFLL